MEQLPEFWRTEVFHPLSVHFPIALLLVSLLFKLVFLFWKREVWNLGGSILLYLGLIGIWIAIYTGNLADGIVSRKICDPTILKDHQNLSYTCAWIFTTAGVLDLLQFTNIDFLKRKKRIYHLILVLTMTVGSGFLIYVGHLGATLVYQQAAGVYTPSQDCAEFE